MFTGKRYESLKARYHRGSLPLKKRRVSIDCTGFAPFCKPEVDLKLLPRSTALDDTKMTTLSLIAAAAAATETTMPSSSPIHPLQGDMRSTTSKATSSDDEEGDAPVQSTDQPLPGYCHGLTSRNNTFCRKQCYKGSNFCKLHYQSHQDRIGQDKRYTGSEPRCSATTTRGRACAYIAVNDTKYCFLHADYDINPPPRRGGKKEEIEEETKVTAPKKRFRRTTAKLAEKHADSTYPLLSMISTDQWYGKTVTVASGPLAGRIGTVKKTSNGWVTIEIEGVGLHNRRSFELHLQEEDVTDPGILRCVSRDVVSPSPSDTCSSKSSSTRSATPKQGRALASLTPLTPKPLASIDAEAALETPVMSLPTTNIPKVTPYNVKATTKVSDLQLPSAMIFRAAMSERTRSTLKYEAVPLKKRNHAL